MKIKTIGEWLKAADLICTDIIVWVDGDEDFGPLWEGHTYDFPLRFADLKLCYKPKDPDNEIEKPIEFRNDLGEKRNHRPGFVVIVEG